MPKLISDYIVSGDGSLSAILALINSQASCEKASLGSVKRSSSLEPRTSERVLDDSSAERISSHGRKTEGRGLQSSFFGRKSIFKPSLVTVTCFGVMARMLCGDMA